MNRDALNLIDRYNSVLEGLEDSAIAQIDAALNRAYRALEREFLRQYPLMQAEGTMLSARARTAALLAELAPVVNIVDPLREEEFIALFEALINEAGGNGAEMAAELIEAIASEEVQAFSGVNIEAVALEARDASRRLYRYNQEFQSKASGIIEQGLLQGFGAQRVARTLRGEMGLARFNAERIARTEVLSALNDAAQMRYQQNNVEGVQWVATIGEVCPFCVARNMKVYQVGKVRVPAHPFCRCVLIPWRQEWQELGLTDDEFSEEYRRDRLRDLEQQGGRPNNGLTPFERAAKLTEPPTPIWEPQTRATTPAPTPPPARRSPTPPAPDAPTPPAAPTTLPRDHVFTQNGRFRRDSLDASLDAIATPGASERVGQFRRFVDKHQIQVFAYDESRDGDRQIDAAMNRIRRGDPRLTEEEFRSFLEPLEGANGYTGEGVNHIFLRTQSARRSDPFGVDGDRLNQIAAQAFEGDHFTLSGIALEGITPETEYAQRRSAADTANFVTYLHEMGHQVHNRAGKPRHPSGELVSATEYGLENDEENFAEGFALWMLDGDRYRREDPEGANWIEQALRRASE